MADKDIAHAGAQVIPVILTYNEEANLARALESLTWARQVLVVDSGSTDATERIARTFANVRWLVRPFDNHGAQWAFAIRAAGEHAPYVLALDADYQVPPSFVRELHDRFVPGAYAGGTAGFEYRIGGRPLLGSVYPAKLVLVRHDAVTVTQPGHSQELAVDGPVYHFAARLVHDDRKPLTRFVASQLEYSRLEAERLAGSEGVSSQRWQDRVRRLGVMPLVAGCAAYARAGGPFGGSAALRYAYERVVFECLLALRILDEGPRSDQPAPTRQQPAESVDRQ